MTVMENLQMGATVADLAHFDDELERVFVLFPRLKERIRQRAAARSRAASSRCSRSRAR